jgi:hypothetical protein
VQSLSQQGCRNRLDLPRTCLSEYDFNLVMNAIPTPAVYQSPEDLGDCNASSRVSLSCEHVDTP